ncbi:MAG: dTDP-4-dehydrorhamnose reductase [Actinomycetota bacterium]|nr:dTDP-4-dehydrorhamnose reductase [Actinomycetota bacterium]MDA8279865.1 dTDP-4-dehydrorhamnose reductase [Actinomycetota bacterium]
MRVVVTGAAGQLGRDLVDVLSGREPMGGCGGASGGAVLAGVAWPRGASPGRGLEVLGTDLPELDLTDRAAVRAYIETVRPDAVVHAAAWTAVDDCEGDPDRAFAANALATRHVVEAAGRMGAHVVYISTDYVFDGTSPRPYLEWDPPRPMSVYGRSKHAGELEVGDRGTVVRTSWVCGFHGANMVKTVLRLAGSPGPLRFVGDQHGSPTFTADLAPAIARLVAERRPGVFHLTNSGATTWFGFAQAVLAAAGHDAARVEPIATADLDPPRPAPRPASSVLDNAAWRLSGLPALADWNDALGRLVAALGVAGPGVAGPGVAGVSAGTGRGAAGPGANRVPGRGDEPTASAVKEGI